MGFYALVAAEAAVGGAEGPAEGFEGFTGGVGDSGFEAEDAFGAEVGGVFAHGLGAAFVVPAGAVAGGLDVEAVVDAVDDDLRLALRLHVAAHDAEGHPGLAVFGGEAGDDGLEGALAGGVDVGMAVLEGEEFATVLEHEAEAVGDEAGAHAAEVGLDLRDHDAVFVGDGEVGGVAVAGGLAGMDGSEDAVELDLIGALLCVLLGVEPVDGDFGEVRVGVVAGAVFVGEALGFDLDVEGFGGLEAHVAEVETFGDVEELESGEALGVGGHGVDVDAAVVGDDGVEPLGVLGAEVFDGDPSADAFEVGFDGFGDGAVVVGVAAAFGDEAIGAGEVGVAADVAFVGGFAVGGEGVEGVGGFFDAGAGFGEVGEVEFDVVADDLWRGGAGFAVVDGGFEELGPFEFAVALMEGPPGVECAGDGDGDGSVGGEGSVFCAGAGDVEGEGFGGAAGAGERDDFFELGVPDHGVAVAADAAGGGFDEAEDGVGGDGGVDGGATFFEDFDGGEGREGVCGAGGSAASHGGGAGGEACSGDAVAGVDVGAVEFFCACGLEFRHIFWHG